MNIVEAIQSVFIHVVFLICSVMGVVSLISLYQLVFRGGIRVSEFDLRTGNLPPLMVGDKVEFQEGPTGVIRDCSDQLVEVLLDLPALKWSRQEIRIMTVPRFWKSVTLLGDSKVYFTGWIP